MYIDINERNYSIKNPYYIETQPKYMYDKIQKSPGGDNELCFDGIKINTKFKIGITDKEFKDSEENISKIKEKLSNHEINQIILYNLFEKIDSKYQFKNLNKKFYISTIPEEILLSNNIPSEVSSKSQSYDFFEFEISNKKMSIETLSNNISNGNIESITYLKIDKVYDIFFKLNLQNYPNLLFERFRFKYQSISENIKIKEIKLFGISRLLINSDCPFSEYYLDVSIKKGNSNDNDEITINKKYKNNIIEQKLISYDEILKDTDFYLCYKILINAVGEKKLTDQKQSNIIVWKKNEEYVIEIEKFCTILY